MFKTHERLVGTLLSIAATLAALAGMTAAPAGAQPLLKSAVQVGAGNMQPTGQTFGYRLTYNCSSTSGPCLNAQVVDLLPAEVQLVSTVPASPAGDVAAINVTPNFMGSGRTRVQFVMNSPLTAGNSGDLLVNVRFPDGSTPNGTVAANAADGINLSTTPGTFTTPVVDVTATATLHVALQKTLLTSPANLDLPVSYRLRIAVGNNGGDLELTAIGPVVDTLPAGVVFTSASPAADCEPGCDGTTPATVTWTSPCTVPLGPGASCNIQVNVVFPSVTFTSGASVTNSFTAAGKPLGGASQSLGQGQLTHPVTTFVPNASVGLGKNVAGASANPPTLDQSFAYELAPANNGNVPLDGMTVIDTLPVQLAVASVSTGAYNNLSDFSAGVGVQVSYEKNTAPGVFTLWGSSPNAATNTTLTAPPPGLGAGEYLTRAKWTYGQAQPGMNASSRPQISGQIVNPDHAGNPVAAGNSIQNCASLAAVYVAGPTNVSRNACRTFTLSGPFVQLNPGKDNLSGGGPFNPGQAVSWRLRVRSAPQSSDPAPLAGLVAADLLPVDLVYGGSWSFDDQGSGLPAPQAFTQIPNYAGTGRTLLRWSWNAGSGSLGVNQQVFILFGTTVRSGAAFGPLANTMDLASSSPGLGQRCSGSSQVDVLDLAGLGNTQTVCTSTGTITVAPIAQLVSNKQVRGICDGGFTAASSGTLAGGAIRYQLQVRNAGTVPMQNMVIIDILPFVGDTGVRDTSPRGSQWTPLLAAPILPPAGTTLYYSTSGNPCRPEVGGPTSGCDAPGWTTVPPVPITAARSFKLDFGSRVVSSQDVVSFTFQLIMPGNLPAGSAFNSFAYQANRADGLGSLAAEPQKVGIAPGSCAAAALGDFVWVDANGNGLQDDGPTGLNGAAVRLYSPGADGIPGTPDDVLLATTVTQQGPAATPGWYSFPGLAPGSYYVCAAAPPTFVFTVPNAGAAGTDSVANQKTGCSPLVTLAANQQDLAVDFGLLATRLAALGDYVWFDRNGDGVQNESTWDGANGVTVKLWADNGNGIAEPGTGDALVATTLTADDSFGRPGYYRFDGLIPGISYYAQFVLPAAAVGFTPRHAGADPTVDSDANPATGVTQMVVLTPGQYDSTLDAGLQMPAGALAIGDQVWLDANNDGLFQPQSGETGIDGVRLDLYLDANGDGLPTAGELVGTTFTDTLSGFSGRYHFTGLAAGNYVVVVDPSNFSGSGPLAGLASSTGNDPAPSANACADGVDKGKPIGALTGTSQFTLTAGQTGCGSGGPNTNFTVDFGFVPLAQAPQPHYDYGDAPDNGATLGPGSYNTTALHNGPHHLLGVANAPFLGFCVDADTGFNQDPLAQSDDLTPSGTVIGACQNGGKDEDGVVFTGPFTPGGVATFTVTAGGPVPCVLNAWVDWNRDGTFGNSPGEQIASDLLVAPGTPAVLTPTVPAGAAPGITYARFRCSTATGLGPTGPAPDGEVEDYALSVAGYDYGDAPQSYGTAGPGAARHLVDPLAPPLMLGRCVDTEPDGQPSAGADGDDKSASANRIGNCFNDEDGVTFPTPLAACMPAQVNVFVTGTGGKLDAWFDFTQSGTFNAAGSQVFTSLPLAPGSHTLSFTVPCSAGVGTSYARFRLSSAGGLGPTGTAGDGEVEDYLVNLVEHPVLGLAKRLASVTPDPSSAGSSQVAFTLYLVNMGNVALANVNAVDNLAAVFAPPASYSVVAVTSPNFTVDPAFDGNAHTSLLAAGNTLAVGQTGTIQLVVKANAGGKSGPYSNSATASGVSPARAPVTDVSQAGTDPDPDHDGNPGNDGTPTVFDLPIAIAQIPTLDGLGLAALVALLGAMALWSLRRERRPRNVSGGPP
jgi:uncharacterized repeat protein (TIGR01451 family)